MQGVVAAAPVPAVYNNLGVLYANVGDLLNAREAFRAALSRDPGYGPARANLAGLKFPGLAADQPVTQEVEPNNSPVQPNVIALGLRVAAAVENQGDKDCFRFQAPPRPRDIVEIRVENRSKTLVAALQLFDADRRYMTAAKAAGKGADLIYRFSPAPDAVYFVEVWGEESTSARMGFGQAAQGYDAYEPNDDLPHAGRIGAPGTLEAGIMDARDKDYYEFESPRSGAVAVQSATGRAR